mmetsp:Transcript_21243/g.42678  ORF Transcript_21243/g.42678 Transcript_21243/m.42678 type:complete len:93 (-) Transcript_21243:55-333(-)
MLYVFFFLFFLRPGAFASYVTRSHSCVVETCDQKKRKPLSKKQKKIQKTKEKIVARYTTFRERNNITPKDEALSELLLSSESSYRRNSEMHV